MKTTELENCSSHEAAKYLLKKSVKNAEQQRRAIECGSAKKRTRHEACGDYSSVRDTEQPRCGKKMRKSSHRSSSSSGTSTDGAPHRVISRNPSKSRGESKSLRRRRSPSTQESNSDSDIRQNRRASQNAFKSPYRSRPPADDQYSSDSETFANIKPFGSHYPSESLLARGNVNSNTSNVIVGRQSVTKSLASETFGQIKASNEINETQSLLARRYVHSTPINVEEVRQPVAESINASTEKVSTTFVKLMEYLQILSQDIKEIKSYIEQFSKAQIMPMRERIEGRNG